MPSLKFNTQIYKKKAIQKAITDYSHFARFGAKNNKDYIKVNVTHIDPEVKTVLVDEFANYVLGMTKKCL